MSAVHVAGRLGEARVYRSALNAHVSTADQNAGIHRDATRNLRSTSAVRHCSTYAASFASEEASPAA